MTTEAGGLMLIRTKLQRGRLPGDLIPRRRLQARAGEWFARNGSIDEALHHFGAADDTAAAVALVARHRYALRNRAQWPRLDQYLQRFSPDTVDQSPDLLLLKAWPLYHCGQFTELPASVEGIEAALAHTPLPEEAVDPLEGEISALRTIISCLAVNAESALVHGRQTLAELGSYKDGWMLISGAFGHREMMQGKYLIRAAAAYFGLWGNTLEEAFCPECSIDAAGEALDCSKNNYVLHFGADQLPPVKAFWSLSMYKLPEQLFIANPIQRYTIGDRTPGLQYGPDGSLTIYLQHESPCAEAESNRLPAPDGPFSLQARLYWPKPEALEPLYAPPPVKKA